MIPYLLDLDSPIPMTPVPRLWVVVAMTELVVALAGRADQCLQ
jgi:hypothetical protein